MRTMHTDILSDVRSWQEWLCRRQDPEGDPQRYLTAPQSSPECFCAVGGALPQAAK